MKHLCALLLIASIARLVMADVDRLSELQDRFTASEQGWGEMGINTCAHAAQVNGPKAPVNLGRGF